MFIEPLPWRDPADWFAPVAGDPWVAWLDSGGPAGTRGRFGYLCFDPMEARTGGGFTALADLARPRKVAGPVPFLGGVVGLLSYELAAELERLRFRHADDIGLPAMGAAVYERLVAYDRQTRQAWLIAPDDGPRTRAFRQRLREGARHWPVPELHWRPETGREAYLAGVARMRDYIRAGDVFEANFTARHLASRPADLHPAGLYLALRARSPNPFGAYLSFGDGRALCSASPENFIRLSADGWIETRPIKGTRPRDPDPARDAALAAELAASEKDRAENLMIVDLMRNDLGRVAEIGSVQVRDLFAVESFASAHHLVSSVTARLRPGLSAMDLLRAVFPGGSVTGAPKLRAMEIIDELEAARRGAYCGSVVWIGFDGAMDSSIVIRSLAVGREKIAAQAGGAVLAESDPAAEYEEMLVKLRPLIGEG